jgi:hypothetical protein
MVIILSLYSWILAMAGLQAAEKKVYNGKNAGNSPSIFVY